MIYRVPIEFEKGFENETKYYKESIFERFTESDYNIITKTIEDVFGYEIIRMEYYYDPICFGDNYSEVEIYDKYGNEITTKNGNRWGGYKLFGILTFDNFYKRFVIFQFREDFVNSEIKHQINRGIDYFSFYYNDIGIQYKNIYIKNSKDGEINTDLTKLIVIYRESHDSQIMKYYDRYTHFGKIVELWNYLSVDNFSLIKKTNVDFREIKWNNIDTNENDFIKLFDLSDDTIYKYEIFKEYLKLYFKNISIHSGINTKKVDKFISDTYRDYNIEREEDEGEVIPYGSHPSQSISTLRQFIEKFTNYHNNKFYKNKKVEISVNYKEFLYCSINFDSFKWNLISREKDYKLTLTLNFIENHILIKLILEDGMIEGEIEELYLCGSTSFSEIKNYIGNILRNEYKRIDKD